MAGRHCRQCSWCERIYLVTTVLGLLTGIGFALYGIVKDKFETPDSSYLFIFIVNTLFALVYAIKGIKYNDPYDLGILVLSVAPPTIYVIVNYWIGSRTDVKEARLIVAVPFAVFIVGIGCYHLVGFCKTKKFMEYYGIKDDDRKTSVNSESKDLKKCLRTMLLYYFLISVNLQIDLSASVFTLTSGYAVELKSGMIVHEQMLYLFVPIMIVAVAACLAAYIAIRRESTRFIVAFAIFSAVLVSAGIYLMTKSIEDLHKPERDHVLIVVATFTSALMIFVRIITCTGSYLAYQNFGMGLKERVYQTMPEESSLLRSLPGEGLKQFEIVINM